MEFYNIMMGVNSLLLVICLSLTGTIWKGMQRDKENTRDDLKEIWKSIHKQNQSIMDTLRMAELNQQSIKMNQREILEVQQDIKEQNKRVNKLESSKRE